MKMYVNVYQKDEKGKLNLLCSPCIEKISTLRKSAVDLMNLTSTILNKIKCDNLDEVIKCYAQSPGYKAEDDFVIDITIDVNGTVVNSSYFANYHYTPNRQNIESLFRYICYMIKKYFQDGDEVVQDFVSDMLDEVAGFYKMNKRYMYNNYYLLCYEDYVNWDPTTIIEDNGFVLDIYTHMYSKMIDYFSNMYEGDPVCKVSNICNMSAEDWDKAINTGLNQKTILMYGYYIVNGAIRAI